MVPVDEDEFDVYGRARVRYALPVGREGDGCSERGSSGEDESFELDEHPAQVANSSTQSTTIRLSTTTIAHAHAHTPRHYHHSSKPQAASLNLVLNLQPHTITRRTK
jgi:hypothetical protein